MDKKQKEEKIRLRLNNLFKMICNVWDKTPRENQNVLWNVIDIKGELDCLYNDLIDSGALTTSEAGGFKAYSMKEFLLLSEEERERY